MSNASDYLAVISTVGATAWMGVYVIMPVIYVSVFFVQRKNPTLGMQDIVWSRDPKYKLVRRMGQAACLCGATAVSCLFASMFFK